jgi:hypothetical protein
MISVVLAAASDPVPDDNNVVAGWLGFAVLILLVVAVVFILRSFTKQLRKVDAARQKGVYDDSRDQDSQQAPQQAAQEAPGPSPTRHED